jgi:hypothetical protein
MTGAGRRSKGYRGQILNMPLHIVSTGLSPFVPVNYAR